MTFGRNTNTADMGAVSKYLYIRNMAAVKPPIIIQGPIERPATTGKRNPSTGKEIRIGSTDSYPIAGLVVLTGLPADPKW